MAENEELSQISQEKLTKGCLSIVIFGGTGDLAKKKTFPALLALASQGLLPQNYKIFAYGRSRGTNESLREKLWLEFKECEGSKAFLEKVIYCQGEYSSDGFSEEIKKEIQKFESACPDGPLRRLYYLAVPPVVYASIMEGVFANVPKPNRSNESWSRFIVEKPFGHDSESSEKLAQELSRRWSDDSIYRIDHYLGKEMVQNILAVRFGNIFFCPMWSRHYISSVQITFKEKIGTQGRGGYFDQYGIIRDVIQNHLMEVLALIAMDCPVSLSSSDILNEKMKVWKSIKPIVTDDVVLGQYIGNSEMPGYLEDDTIANKSSTTPTFASCILYIQNENWDGIPFILKAGKAMDEKKVDIRLQMRRNPYSVFRNVLRDANLESFRNEIVIKLQPNEAIYTKFLIKTPGSLGVSLEPSELDLSYVQRYQKQKNVRLPEAYERLILDAILGDQKQFVQRESLATTWAIFTPILHAIDRGDVPVAKYKAGTRGPPEADQLLERVGYMRSDQYVWASPDGPEA